VHFSLRFLEKSPPKLSPATRPGPRPRPRTPRPKTRKAGVAAFRGRADVRNGQPPCARVWAEPMRNEAVGQMPRRLPTRIRPPHRSQIGWPWPALPTSVR
jgi:hypothetical protein